MAGIAVVMVAVAVAVIALWRTTTGQDGLEPPLASLSDLRAREIIFVEEHHLYLVLVKGGPVLAFSNDAQHVGDVVEFCVTSRMFESAAHGEKFDILGNYFAGPARRGLDRYPVRLQGDQIHVDLDGKWEGTARGHGALEPSGDFCTES